MNIEALFKISYGLYLVSSGDKNYGNGFISNTVFQVTAEPMKFAACCNKNNYSSEIIQKYNAFSVSILKENTSSEIFGRFGYKTGKDFNKMEGMNIKYGATGVPIILNDSIAFIECKVVDRFDVGTHWIFIGELMDSEILDDKNEPLTYSYYRNIKKGLAPKNAPTYIDKTKLENKSENTKSGKHQCTACGYIYDENIEKIKFNDLPNDWKCPDCGADKEDFMEI